MLRKLLSFQRYPEFARLAWWRFITPLLMRRAGVVLGNGVQFFGLPIVSLAPHSKIVLGDKVSLCSQSKFTALGVNHPVILRTLQPGASIVMGKDTGMSGGSICAAMQVQIGDYCMIGANVTITDTNFHAIKASNRRHNNRPEDIATAPVYIGDNVFLGTGVIVLKGVKIGHNSVIGAGSVVSKDVPPNTIATGNPAVVVGHVSP